jgi:predicted nucleic acid-binding protein
VTALLDTSFLLALTNAKDRNHARVLKVAQTINDTLTLPTPVLPEICYLIASRLGYAALPRFLNEIVASDTILEPISSNDLERVIEILEKYADSQLDFVDATVIAVAERLNVVRILTLDRRDFTIVRPKHCTHFEILP